MYVDASIQCQHLRLCAFPKFWTHPNQHYDGGEWIKKELPENAELAPTKGPLVIHAAQGFYDTDGVMECRHDHQMPVLCNIGEKQLYRCMDCGIISEGPSYTSCNLLDPTVMSPKEIDEQLRVIEKDKNMNGDL
jgi:hypothetical protein